MAADTLRATAAEEAVLGALMLDHRSAWPKVAPLIRPEYFDQERHRRIFGVVRELVERGQAADPVTVSDHLQARGELEQAGGLAYLGTLARDTPTAANAETYAQRVREAAGKRYLRRMAGHVVQELEGGSSRSTADIAADWIQRLTKLQAGTRIGRGLLLADELTREVLEDLDRRANGHRGLSVGLSDFDQLTGGLEPGDLVVMAGRPGMGKTAVLVALAATVARSLPVAVFSAEMPAAQLMRRALASASGIGLSNLRAAAQLTTQQWGEITRAAGELGSLRLSIDDRAAPTLEQVRAECIALQARSGLSLVLVDYLQLMRGEGHNRYEELRTVSYGLKALAKELQVPVIALAQLNREVEKRDDKRPSVSDLRDSGAIEEAADVIALLYSEAHYSPDFSMPYVLEASVAKNRNGERGGCLWVFDKPLCRITTADDAIRAQYQRALAQARTKQTRGADL